MENQAVGLAEAMGLTPVVKRVILKTPWRILSPHITAFKRYAISKRGDQIEAPWPDILIATGRPSILPSLYVKGQSSGRTFTVQLQDPVSLRHRFDRIMVPAHDGLSGKNVIVMDGALHRINPERLAAEAPRWESRFAHIPRPRVAVLLGGPNARYSLGTAEIGQLAAQLKALARKALACLSPVRAARAPPTSRPLENALEGQPAFISDGGGDNPYFGMLAHADAFIVTCDSVNMITEACSTGKPVHVVMLPTPGLVRRRARQVLALPPPPSGKRAYTGFRRPRRTWTYEPLREMERVARLVREAYLAR